jgi:homocysteine S-methyltransferase
LLRRSVELAVAARDDWASGEGTRARRPLVAASIGPYGAYLHDGSEYRGDYNCSRIELASFHRTRFDVLAGSGADLLACEAIPSLKEAEALLDCLHEHPSVRAWFTFTCRDRVRTSAGEYLDECARRLDGEDQVAALGANCFPPSWSKSIVRTLRGGTQKPILIYPNSGETWNPDRRSWKGNSAKSEWVRFLLEAIEAGAGCVGGCCRTTPEHIRLIRGVIDSQ